MQPFITNDFQIAAVSSTATAIVASIIMQSAAFVLITIGVITLAVIGFHFFTGKKIAP